MKSITVVAILVVAVAYCDLVSGRPNVEKEHKQNETPEANGQEKQDEIEKLVKNFDPIFAQKYEEFQNATNTIMNSEKPRDEKLKEANSLLNHVGLDYLMKAWNMQLVQWYSKSNEEANEDFESIFKPDSETAKIRKIVNVIRISDYEVPNGENVKRVGVMPDRLSALKRKTQTVMNLLNESDPTLIEIENRILAIYDENKTYRDQNNKIKVYMKSCDESKIHKLEVVSDVYYKNENEDDETIKNKVKEALKNL